MSACKQLTDAGADPLRKDSEGKSALDLGRHFGNNDVIAVLEGAQEERELLALKSMGIGTNRGYRPAQVDPSQRSPTSVSSQLTLA